MSRSHRLVFRLIAILAVATFIFALLQIIGSFHR